MLDSYLRISVDCIKNICVKLHESRHRFKTSEEIFPDIYAILHKLLGNEKASEMLTSAARAHFRKREGVLLLCT